MISIGNVSHEKTWTWLRMRNLERETESLLIAAQNNGIRINHIQTRINKTQQSSVCRLCGDREETINHIISEYKKIIQKEYKTRHGWVGKVIYWELWKEFQFDQTNKSYMYNPKSVLENDTQTPLFWHPNGSSNLGQTTWPNDNQQQKENLQNCGLCDLLSFGLVWFYGKSNSVGYLIPNNLYMYLLNIYISFGFMAYQPFWVIECQILLIYMYWIYVKYIWVGLVWFYSILTIVDYKWFILVFYSSNWGQKS